MPWEGHFNLGYCGLKINAFRKPALAHRYQPLFLEFFLCLHNVVEQQRILIYKPLVQRILNLVKGQHFSLSLAQEGKHHTVKEIDIILALETLDYTH